MSNKIQINIQQDVCAAIMKLFYWWRGPLFRYRLIITRNKEIKRNTVYFHSSEAYRSARKLQALSWYYSIIPQPVMKRKRHNLSPRFSLSSFLCHIEFCEISGLFFYINIYMNSFSLKFKQQHTYLFIEPYNNIRFVWNLHGPDDVDQQRLTYHSASGFIYADSSI